MITKKCPYENCNEIVDKEILQKVSRINFLDKIFTLGISVVKKKSVACIIFFLNTKQTRKLDEKLFQKARLASEQSFQPLRTNREDFLQAADQVRRAS